jgi:outer membrane immunogenic protein
MKRILVAVMYSVVAAGSALAADLPPPAGAPPRAPAVYLPPAPIYNWSGIYFGVNGGWGFGQSDWTSVSTSTGDFNVSGGLVGGTLGVNWQAGAFVAGIEGDFDGSWIDGTTNLCGVPSCETKNTWISTFRGRAGYAADRVLFYATAGGAYGNVVANVASTNFQSASELGWTAGAGIEGAFTPNLTARVEYLFVDLSSASFSSAPGVTVKLNNLSLIRLGVDYKFNLW